MPTNGNKPLDIKIRERSGRRPDRYPEMFKKTAEIWDNPYILCFGCSFGDECHSLRKYHPDCRILGADINEKAIAVARQENKDHQIEFIISRHDTLPNYGPFDIVFALNVLRMNDKNRDKLYPFKLFNQQITALSDMVKNGGGLVISGYQHPFEDTDVYSSYNLVFKEQDRLARIYKKNG
jgi:2-polyprenyl-3-methyl-5-hydroxy-6-metoxy-1,4-benzoquinol methylase